MLEFKGIPLEGVERINNQYRGRNRAAYFSVTPRILRAGKKSTIVVESKDDQMSLTGTFKVLMFPFYEYEYRPFVDQVTEIRDIEAHDGVISFEYEFTEEQMYRLYIAEVTEGGLNLLLKTDLYALDDSLYDLKPLIGDLHSHTIYSDGFESPESLLRAAVACGLDFIAVTDHNNYMGSVEAKKIAEEKKYPITVINGEEYSSTFTNMHIIALGAPAPLDDRYYRQKPEKVETPVSVAAMTKQLCERIRENGGVSVMCHPLWKPLSRDGKRLDVPHSLVKELLESNVFDAVEIVGGSPMEDSMTSHMQHLWAVNYGATPDKMAYLGSTDSHMYSIDPICGKHFTLVFAENNCQEAIVDAVRRRNTVAIQIIDSANALCFGMPRYCMFAQFYIKEVLAKVQQPFF